MHITMSLYVFFLVPSATRHITYFLSMQTEHEIEKDLRKMEEAFKKILGLVSRSTFTHSKSLS
jgi:uncharacterized lipoprotein YehR (DUF1307 family)